MKTAIIGLGPHGRRLLKIAAESDSIEVVGLVDRNESVAEIEDVKLFQFYTSSKELYQNEKPEMVFIATNGPSHATLCLEAIDHGAKRILVEKPMACSIEECNKMIEAAKSANVRLVINKKNRFDPVFQYFKNAIQSGEWGDLRTVYMQVPGIGLGCLGTHWLDISNYLFDQNPENVTAWVDHPVKKNPRGEEFTDPGGLVVLNYGQMKKGILSQIEDGAGPMTLEIHTTAARVFFDPKNQQLDIRVRDLSVIPGPGRPPVYNQVEVPTHFNLKGDMLEQMSGVIDELMDEGEISISGEVGKMAMEMVVAAYVSNENGNIPVRLPLNDDDAIRKYLPIT